MTILFVYIGVGLLKLKKTAWVLTIFFNIYNLLLGIANIFTISETTLVEIAPNMNDSAYQMSMSQMKLIGVIGLLFPVIILAYFIAKRQLFLNKN